MGEVSRLLMAVYVMSGLILGLLIYILVWVVPLDLAACPAGLGGLHLGEPFKPP